MEGYFMSVDNEVMTVIEFQKISKNALNKLKNMLVNFEFVECFYLGYMMIDSFDNLDKDEVINENWSKENIGSDWAYIDEYRENDSILVINSLGLVPIKGIEWILTQLKEIDENLLSFIFYIDKCLEYSGIKIYQGEKLLNEFHLDSIEMINLVIEKLPELKGEYDETTNQWLNEKEFLYYENVLSIVKDVQREFADKVINGEYLIEKKYDK